jgi:uncharacterized repeat protein (TIGR01451 family)
MQRIRKCLSSRLSVENLEGREMLAADLAIAADTSRPVYAGADLIYHVDIRNLGTTAAQNVDFTSTLPAGVSFVSQSQSQGPTFALSQSGGTINDTIASLPAGAIVGIDVTTLIPSDTPDGTRIVASGKVTTTSPDSDPSNNRFQGAVKVNSIANVTIVSSGPVQAKAGNEITYNVAVANNGPSDANSVTFTDALPAGMTLISQTQISGTPFVLSSSGNTISDSAAVMQPGTFARFTVTAQINSGTAPGTVLTNTFATDADNDGNFFDNQSSVQTKVLAGAAPTIATSTATSSAIGSSSSANAPQATKLVALTSSPVKAPNLAAVDSAIASL